VLESCTVYSKTGEVYFVLARWDWFDDDQRIGDGHLG